eukprot:12278577-Ditylum_brightwellii.AAC.1
MLGISKDHYSHLEYFPIYGSGQGTTNSPQILLVISSAINNVCEISATGVESVSSDRVYKVLLAILATATSNADRQPTLDMPLVANRRIT